MQDSLFAQPPDEPAETLDALNAELLQRAKRMPQFKDRIFVLGEGRPGLRVAVVGESPGPPDIESGRPFMGPAGQMLERILAAIGLKRDDCYLTNVVKYISTGDEMTSEVLSFFTPYLHRELRAARPRVVVAFGNTPTRAILNTKKPISQLRGEFHDYHGASLMPTFNPAYLLRDPSKKREVWEDMKKVRDLLAKEPA
ncbi:MAG TPA: uracil-DNA glycosylase [Pyrinomonadaceae bacterium]|nr:uracil-DNA glycosylase [Pyrinomonadaceae bacterium]